ncbi:D-(-)-3-hydroxybutyrate oligomer hydrolase [soil metagenome]
MKKTKLENLAQPFRLAAVLALGAGMLVACGGSDDPAAAPAAPPVAAPPPAAALPTNNLPAGMSQLSITAYSATVLGSGTTAATQDLLTAGLGKSGLASTSVTPVYANPLAPTALELRRNSIRANYAGLVDNTANGGFGTLYGPNLDNSYAPTGTEGLIPGREYLGVLDNGLGTKRVAIAVQIPDSFSSAAACVVIGPSSGSRNVYGAQGAASEWGLKHGCAVALTDAGKGVGLYDMGDDTVNRIDGTRATRADAGVLNFFAATVADAARIAYNALFPNRVALKQVHSQINPEKDWGKDTLAAAKYALYALNDRYGTTAAPVPFTAANTIIIGASVSNGGGAVIRAAEQDTEGLIDGVVANEPNVQPNTATGYSVEFNGTPVPGFGKTMIDYTTYGNIFQPCAALATNASMGAESSYHNYFVAAGLTTKGTARCTALAARGLVTGGSTTAQADDALAKLNAYGWSAVNDTMHSAHFGLGNGPILTAMYPVSYGKFSVTDNICNTSLAFVDALGNPIAPLALNKAQSFALSNGTANNSPGNTTPAVVYNDSVGGAKLWTNAISPTSGTADFGLDNALCLRALVTGVDYLGAPLTSSTVPTLAQSNAVKAGIAEVTFNGNLRAVPTIIVAGRSDALLPINNTSRAYVAYNHVTEGSASKLRYLEVTNAQHFDGFLGLAGFDTRYIPMHVYYNRAMDAMYAYLKNGTALPPSQVIRTTPRGGVPSFFVPAAAITGTNVPAISAAPPVGDQITFTGTALVVPN